MLWLSGRLFLVQVGAIRYVQSTDNIHTYEHAPSLPLSSFHHTLCADHSLFVFPLHSLCMCACVVLVGGRVSLVHTSAMQYSEAAT